MVKEEFQATREKLCTKAAALDRARREVSEAESLVEECGTLCGDLQRWEAMIN